jgi:hypothetical protein
VCHQPDGMNISSPKEPLVLNSVDCAVTDNDDVNDGDDDNNDK